MQAEKERAMLFLLRGPREAAMGGRGCGSVTCLPLVESLPTLLRSPRPVEMGMGTMGRCQLHSFVTREIRRARFSAPTSRTAPGQPGRGQAELWFLVWVASCPECYWRMGGWSKQREGEDSPELFGTLASLLMPPALEMKQG